MEASVKVPTNTQTYAADSTANTVEQARPAKAKEAVQQRRGASTPHVKMAPHPRHQVDKAAVKETAKVATNIRNTPDVPEDSGTLQFPRALSGNDIPETAISNVIDQANKALEPSSFRLIYNIHEATNNVMVTVVDSKTDEVLREIPPESKLDIVARMLEFSGILFDGKG